MSSILGLIFLVFFILLLLGIKRPKMYSGYFAEPVEPKAIKIFGSLALLFFVLTVISVGASNSQRNNLLQINVEKENNLVVENLQTEKKQEEEKQETAIVIKIVDGDTVVLGGERHTRLLAIDTPEKGELCYAEASKRLSDLVLGKEVELKSDIRKVDKYNRLLRFLFYSGENINLKMVEDGLAKCYSFDDDTKYVEECKKMEREARDAGLGCLYQDAKRVEINEEGEKIECLIKGNISYSSEKKIYHIPGCENYDDTVINEEKGERWFCTEEEALVEGWVKAGNCP